MAEVEKQSPKTPENSTREPSVPIGFETVPPLDKDSKCPSTKHAKHRDIWLIKVPAEFDASSLSGKTVVLNGTQDVRIKQHSKGTKARFEVVSKPINKSVPGSFKVLLPSSNDASLWSAKAFVGDMNVIQSVSIPTLESPPPSPDRSAHHVQAPDITCRWKPFGYKKPFSSTTKKAKKDKGKKNARDNKLDFESNQKNHPSKSTHKPETEKGEERKKHKEKIRIKQEKEDHEEDSHLKRKKRESENTSPQIDVQVKIEKSSPVKEKSREKNKKEKDSLVFIPLNATVKTEPLSDEEGGSPRKKRKKEKRK